MKTAARLLILVFVLAGTTSLLKASGPVGIYGIVSKVVLEPNDKSPERIQIWGAFTLVDGGVGSGGRTLTPRRGYLYFALPWTDNANQRQAQQEAALKEWADFRTIAGTGQAVSFGQLGYIGAFSDELISRPAGNPPYVLMGSDRNLSSENPVRAESVAPSKPSVYPLNMGLTKLSSTGDLAAVVKKLEQALKK